MINNNYVIDAHAHLWPEKIAAKARGVLEEYYGFEWALEGIESALLEDMNQSGVDASVVFSVATNVNQVPIINDFLAEIRRRNEGRIISLGSLHPDFADYKAEIRRIKELGHKGVKFHSIFQNFPLDDARAMEIYAEIAENNLPIMFHMGDRKSDFSSPARLAKVMGTIPNLRVIAAHFGGYSEWDAVEQCLVGSDAYFDISSSIGIIDEGQARRIIQNHGADKILFATDFPLISAKDEIANLERLNLTAEEMKLILGENALKAFA